MSTENPILGKNTLRDLDIDQIVSAFDTATVAGAGALRERLQTPLDDAVALAARQGELRTVREACRKRADAVAAARATLRETEADVISVGSAASDPRHAEYYTQLLWAADSRLAWLNEISWINDLVLFFRTIFLPGLTVILPLFVFIMPFIVFTFILKKPLTFDQYFGMIQAALKKAMPSVLGSRRFVGKGGIAETGEQIIHVGAGVVMFAASMWNQVSAALNLRRIAADMRRRADSVRRFTKAAQDLGEAIGVPCSYTRAWSMGDLGVFGEAWNRPDRIQELLAAAGHLDMLAAVGLRRRMCFPQVGGSGGTIHITDIYHPGLEKERRIYNSVAMDASGAGTHVLLTGPNRGGKSTFLKSLGAAVLMTQTLGVVFARRATMPIFGSIITALTPTDTLGQMSLFEAEIEFAKEVNGVIAATGDRPVFLMMDEIFHGTNAHDGVEASQVFLDQLYAGDAPVFSVVSTHYMDLPQRYGDQGQKRTQNLCMDAQVDPADPDRLVYTYRLMPGVNRHSSVREILRERGLLGPGRGLDDQKSSQPASKV
jgi:hypothetical protein